MKYSIILCFAIFIQSSKWTHDFYSLCCFILQKISKWYLMFCLLSTFFYALSILIVDAGIGYPLVLCLLNLFNAFFSGWGSCHRFPCLQWTTKVGPVTPLSLILWAVALWLQTNLSFPISQKGNVMEKIMEHQTDESLRLTEYLSPKKRLARIKILRFCERISAQTSNL